MIINSNQNNYSLLTGGTRSASSTVLAYQQSSTVSQKESFNFESDQVNFSYSAESVLTYNSSLTVQQQENDAYEKLRSLVTDVFNKQGLDTKISTDNGEVDLNTLDPGTAQELVADDGYFGVEKTSDRIFKFAIGIAGGDTSRIDAIREGIDNGFKEALDAFGGWLPDISYDTYDSVMSKLDNWLNGNNPA